MMFSEMTQARQQCGRVALAACLTVGIAGATGAATTPMGAVGLEAQAPAAPPPTAGNEQRLVVPFSDPSRPGTLKVRLVQGGVTVRGGAGREVVIHVANGSRDGSRRPRRERESAANDGLRRLDQPFGVDVEEDGNVVTVSAPPQGDGHLTIEVPARTSLQISVVNGGGIAIDGVEGDIEANNVNGPVALTNVSGTVVAHSVNGGVTASLRQLGKSPMAFTSLNGEVDVTLPASTKASLKLRSDRGEVYTDFDVQTTAPPVGGSNVPRPGDRDDVRGDGREKDKKDKDERRGRGGRGDDQAARDGVRRLRVDRAIYGTINGGGIDIELRTYNGDVRLRKAK